MTDESARAVSSREAMRLPWLPNDRLEQYTTRQVVFLHPFTLDSEPEVYPPGEYEVETREQAVEAGGHTAHVRTATVLVIPTRTGTRCREVPAHDLEQALIRDTEGTSLNEPSENPDLGGTREARSAA